MERGKLFYFSRFFVRLGLGRWSVDVAAPQGPTVYVCSHKNMRGPLATMSWLPFTVRPWVLHVFCGQESCRKQYGEYTFSQRFGLPAFLANFLAWAVSGFVSALMRSLGAIPVYRGTVRIGSTFKETIAALQAGDSVLVFPDVDYTDTSGGIGEVYDGFLLLERFWRKTSEAPLKFVPLRMDVKVRRISEGRAITFDRSVEWRTELNRVRNGLQAEINRRDLPQLRTEG